MHSTRLLGTLPSIASNDLFNGPSSQTVRAGGDIKVFRRYRKNLDPKSTKPPRRRTILPSVTSPTTTSSVCDYTDVFDIKM